MALEREPIEDPVAHRSDGGEPRRLEAENRARAAYELDVLRARSGELERRLGVLRARVDPWRRTLGAVVASTGWERLLELTDGLLASARRSGRSYGRSPPPYARHSPRPSQHTLAAERTRMARLARQLRAYERGLGELSRALSAARLRLRGGAAPSPRRQRPRVRAAVQTRTGLRVPSPVRQRRRQRASNLVTAIVPSCDFIGAARAIRALRRNGIGCELRLVARGASFGPPVAGAIEAAGTPYVLVTSAALIGNQAVHNLVETLERDPTAGVVSARVISAKTATVTDGACAFEWNAGAAVPTVVGSSSADPVAVGGSCLLVRRGALAGCELAAAYRGHLWGVDLSLQLQRRGWGIRVADVTAAAPVRGERQPQGDLELLLDRWGGRLGSLVLCDSLLGGDVWSIRTARVSVGNDAPDELRAACAAAGWELVDSGSESHDLLIAATAGTVTATPRVPGVTAPAALASLDACGGDPSAAAAFLRRALVESLRRPSVALHISDRDERAARDGGDFYLAEALAKELGARGHHAVVRTRADDGALARTSHEVRITLRGRRPAPASPGQLSLLWIISHPAEVDPSELADVDGVLVASEPYARRLAATTSTPVRVLLQFTDPATFRPVPSEERHDILFVGNWRGVFRRAVWDAQSAGFQVALVGHGWRYLAPDDVIADHVAHRQLCALYSSAKVLLADHWEDMRAEGFVSNRIFDGLACGSFMITDAVSGIHNLLPGGIETYDDQEHLSRLLRRYLADEDARRRVATRGRQLVLREHTVQRRVDELLVAIRSTAAASRRTAVDHLAEDRARSPDCRHSRLGAASSSA